MAKYLISFGDHFEDNKIVNGRVNLEKELHTLYNEGDINNDELPVIYELGKKMTFSIDFKFVLKGETK